MPPHRACAGASSVGTQHRETLCSSDPVADGLEELQFTLGEGPCFEAFDTGVEVLVPDLGAVCGSGWPIYASRAVEYSSARAVFVFPLSFASMRVGTMSTYRVTPGPLDAEARAFAVELAETAALVLLGAQDPAGAVARIQREAATRRVGVPPVGHEDVHRAAGMVAEQLHLSTDSAFDRMRGHAFLENRLLVDIAADILARRLRLDQA